MEKKKFIIKSLYEEFEKGKSNINNILEKFTEDEETISIITEIMADDYEIKNDKKAIEDLVKNYQKERLLARKKELLDELSNENLDSEQARALEKELNNTIVKLAQNK